ncbi:dCTP deaminase domain-containing protein [Cellulosilyticum lentocellum]|uniref:dUTP diphosphatase n=1 Tax=Cellulosilyticum lentocellum (strain ATCC 49066 / DSM 5427 / NCIMB 11756 / RHM5) TaxID=642492 RepID=F2JPS3_CELLD|nr:dUTP pyrophosphatase [Cellulosilyticum lentocellum]ADZ83733.1 deoxyUTP pyrophosphatase [Cellulosilyticum lentocellum DSM 5427]
MNEQQIYFAKVKENAIIPSKRVEDGAFDIYACFEEDYKVIEPHETLLVPTGLASAFSTDYVAILKERGSTGTKGMGQRAGVVDSGYRGEWFIPITNHNSKPLVIMKEDYKDQAAFKDAIIYPYEKALSQCIMVRVPQLSITEISYEELLKFESERGTGRLGSSGK